MKKVIIYLFVYAVLTAVLISCGGADAKENEQNNEKAEAVKVKVESLKSSEEPIPITGSGILVAKSEAKLSFKIGGIISALYANEGQFVSQGQTLAKLELTEINSQIEQAEDGLEKAARDLNRARNLYADTVGTLEQVQNAETAYNVSKQNVRILEYNQRYASIVAPSSGKIITRNAEVGELAAPGVPIFLMTTNSDAQVIQIGLADRHVVKVRLGDRAKVYFDAYPNEVFTGQVTYISDIANPRTGTFEVELTVINSPFHLKNGFVAKAEILPSNEKGYFKVPMGAIVQADKKSVSLFVPDRKNKTAKKIRVQVMEIGNDYVAIRQEELEGITEVITDGASYLKNGSLIEF